MAELDWTLCAMFALAASWILAAAGLAERLGSIGVVTAYRLHVLAVAAFVAFACLGLVRLSPGTVDHGVRPSPAQFSFTTMGKYVDLPPMEDAASVPPLEERSASSVTASGALGLVWVGGALVCLCRLGMRWWTTAVLVARSRPVEDQTRRQGMTALAEHAGWPAPLRLFVSDAVRCPMVWGPPWTFLLVPPEFLEASENEQHMAIVHELAHVERRDALLTVAVQLACVCFWFHPLVWRAARRVEQLQEQCADRHVIERGFRTVDYAAYLLATARRVSSRLDGLGALPVVGRSPLNERFAVLVRGAAASPPVSGLRRVAAAIAVLGAVAGPAAWWNATHAASASKPPAPTYESIDALLHPLLTNKLQDFHIAGASVSVVRGDRILYAKGFGRAEVFDGVPVDPGRTIFRIGSISKVMTGVAVMQLVDRGLVDLDADVNRYFEQPLVDGSFARPVRVRDLLTHTAGFDQLGYGRHVDSEEEKTPLGEYIADNLVRIRPPGDVTCYDTYAITLAGYLVEVVSGLSYEDYLLKHIFRPLGMHRTGIRVPPALSDDVAVGYAFAGEWEAQPWEFMNTDPASTVNSTATDMARFMMMMLNEGELRGTRILASASARAMRTPQFRNHPELPGFGLTLWEDRGFGVSAFSHGGSMNGYSTYMYLVPEEELGVFVAYNQETGRLASAVLRAFVDAFLQHRVEPTPRRADWSAEVDLERFTGTYAGNGYNHTRPERGGWQPQPFELTTDSEGRLVFGNRPCRPVGPLLFERDDGLLLAFRENEAGEITHMFVQQTVYERYP